MKPPIRRGTARALGLRTPAPQPSAIVRFDGVLSDAELEECRRRFAEALKNPHLEVLTSTLEVRQPPADASWLQLERCAPRRRWWPFRRTRARG